jgi:hypothetical protein
MSNDLVVQRVAGAPDPVLAEVETSTAFIRAGVEAISGRWLDMTAEVDPIPLSVVVLEVFAAMEAVHPQSQRQVL